MIGVYVNSILILFIAFLISSICVPLVIKLAIKKRLLGEYGEGRHVHKGFVPRLGGVAIFAGLFFSQIYFLLSHYNTNLISQAYLLIIFCSFVMFLVGTLDDLINIKASLKFVIQIIISLILVWQADVRIISFYGLFGIDSLPMWFSYLFSIAVITFFINGYNLIDGIDSLSASIGMYVIMCFSLVFIYNNLYQDVLLAFSIIGSLIGFWLYNKPPARIFMGDSGTLSIGLIIACFAIKASNLPIDAQNNYSPVFAMIVLVYPVIDTLRVFTKRILNGVSPFTPDKNHIHHLLLNIGCSHGKATKIIILFSLLLTSIAYCLRENQTISFIVTVLLTIIVSYIPSLIIKSLKK